MKYEIEFNNNSVDRHFFDICFLYEWSENYFENRVPLHNITNTVKFENAIRNLRIFGADTETNTHNDNNYLRIRHARINNHEFIKHGVINKKELKDALWEIAHPEEKED